mgnify:CR=1 FL=1
MGGEDEVIREQIKMLACKVNSNNAETSALMSIVIQTNKETSNNLVKLTEVVSKLVVLEKIQMEHQQDIIDLKSAVNDNETGIKLATQNSEYVKDSLGKIEKWQGAVTKWFGGIVAALMVAALIGGLMTKLS